MNNHPHLAELYAIYKIESQPFRKVHRMIDLFESIIKTHTVVIMSSYVNYNKLSDTAKGLLAQGLRTPSLGTWQLFSRELFKELESDGFTWPIASFSSEFLALDKTLNAEKTNVIAFRNNYAHGATPTDTQCEANIVQFEPYLERLLALQWLVDSAIEIIDHKVVLQTQQSSISLHPLLLYRPETKQPSIAFFNDIKNDKIGILNYPLSKHYREKDFLDEFHQYLPLHEWKKSGNTDFHQRIEELTETFKGRIFERQQLMEFITTQTKGYCSIQGNPGIGKSALIAQFFKDIRTNKAQTKSVKVIEYFIRRGTQQAQVDYVLDYLNKRTDEHFPKGREIRAEGKMPFDVQNQLFAKWRLWSEHCEGNKLLFLIDGLDEGAENEVLKYLPRENFEHILIIYGSRPGGHKSIDELWATLPVTHHQKIELIGLNKEDIRALIYEVANKYLIERDSPWIDALQQRSEGNPLYLRLLCDALENGSMHINNINELPKAIDEYYKAILQRYAQDRVDGDALLTGLFTFAAAEDYLTMAHLGLINKLGPANVHRIGSTLKEVLYENPLTQEVLDYQLFHESFREYLVKHNSKEIQEVTEHLIDFCSTWQELESSWEQRYPLEHYASHLAESKKVKHHETLMDLIYNKAFATDQMKVLKSFEASNRLYQLALLKASNLNMEDHMLGAALCLVDLKYEEANEAPQVVAMVANGEMELALKRIERFGGVDKDGVKRKFILYMLCLMELTLLESKDKAHSKKAIEKLLNHLDEQIPADTSLINWNDFFSSYTIFLMASEWATLGLDYLIVYKRTNDWKTDWIKEKGPFTDSQLEVLLACSRGISNESDKSIALVSISDELFQQGKIEEATLVLQVAVECTSNISDETKKSFALNTIAVELAKQGKLDEAGLVIHEALECARGISTEESKSGNLAAISTELLIQGNKEEATLVIDEALEFSRGISDLPNKSLALLSISSELAKQGKIEEAASLIKESLSCVLVLGISNDYLKISALGNIALQMARLENVTEALDCVRYIRIPFLKIKYLAAISSVLSKKEKKGESASAIQEAIKFANGISDEPDKSLALSSISSNLAKQGKIEEALSCARTISINSTKSIELKVISRALSIEGKNKEATSVIQEAVECARGISDETKKSSTLNFIAVELANQVKFAEYASIMRETITCSRGLSSEKLMIRNLSAISSELVTQGKVAEALGCARAISDELDKSLALSNISGNLAKQGKIEESLLVIRETLASAHYFSDEYEKSNALVAISNVLANHGKLEEAASVMQEAIECAHDIGFSFLKAITLEKVFTELVQQGKLAEALECARGNSSKSDSGKSDMSKALATIATELWLKGNLEGSASTLKEALECALDISDDYYKIKALVFLSTQLQIQEKFEESVLAIQEAHTCALGINDDFGKSRALDAISTALAKQGKTEEAAYAMQESLGCARSISDESDKSSALSSISTELAKQQEVKLAEQIGLEIKQIAERHSCWKEMAISIKKLYGWQIALESLEKLQNEEARSFYLKGWAENITVCDAIIELVTAALPYFVKDTESIEKIMQLHALHEVAFNAAPPEKIKQLNTTLNIQWFLDIHNSLPQPPTATRLSTNLDTWLHEIEDEDDQDQITLWAKQVAKGKITEEEFQVKINTL